jgi:ketosteroid isomerase-like protein
MLLRTIEVKTAILGPYATPVKLYTCPYMDTLADVRYGAAALLLTLLAVSAGCKPPPPRDTHDADLQTLTEIEVQWVRQWSERDAVRIVSHYSDDALVMAPNLPPAAGRQAILEMVKQFVSDGDFALTFDATRVVVAGGGDYGYVQGSYTLTMTDPVTKKPSTDLGGYLRIYRKQTDGAWKVVQEIRASRLPAAPPTPSQ